jgi:hypothetical protein
MALYFMAGWIMHSCINSLAQDFLGKEKCLKMIDENWIDKAVSIPFAIVGIIIALFLMVIK